MEISEISHEDLRLGTAEVFWEYLEILSCIWDFEAIDY